MATQPAILPANGIVSKTYGYDVHYRELDMLARFREAAAERDREIAAVGIRTILEDWPRQGLPQGRGEIMQLLAAAKREESSFRQAEKNYEALPEYRKKGKNRILPPERTAYSESTAALFDSFTQDLR